jgi:hypothetical protein
MIGPMIVHPTRIATEINTSRGWNTVLDSKNPKATECPLLINGSQISTRCKVVVQDTCYAYAHIQAPDGRIADNVIVEMFSTQIEQQFIDRIGPNNQ